MLLFFKGSVIDSNPMYFLSNSANTCYVCALKKKKSGPSTQLWLCNRGNKGPSQHYCSQSEAGGVINHRRVEREWGGWGIACASMNLRGVTSEGAMKGSVYLFDSLSSDISNLSQKSVTLPFTVAFSAFVVVAVQKRGEEIIITSQLQFFLQKSLKGESHCKFN